MNSSSNWSIDQRQRALVVGQHPADGPADAGWAARELIVQARRRVDGDAQQRRFELLERVAPRGHGDHEPLSGAGQSTSPEGGEDAGAHDARLAAPARPHHRNEAAASAGLAQTGEQPLHLAPSAEEILGIGLLDASKPLYGFSTLDARSTAAAPKACCSASAKAAASG